MCSVDMACVKGFSDSTKIYIKETYKDDLNFKSIFQCLCMYIPYNSYYILLYLISSNTAHTLNFSVGVYPYTLWSTADDDTDDNSSGVVPDNLVIRS